MIKQIVKPKFEVVNIKTGAVQGIYPTHRRACNRAHGYAVVRRVRPMEYGDLFGAFESDIPVLARFQRETLQENGFWQPTGYNKYTGRYEYYL